MLPALLPLLLLTRAITAQVTVTPYDVCSGYVSNVALPPILYNDTSTSQTQCWTMCDNNAACLSVAWGSKSDGSVRCNLFSANVDPTTLVANPFNRLATILVAYKREPNSLPTANLPSGCTVASLSSTTSTRTVANATATATATASESDITIPTASATLDATVDDTPTASADSTVISASATLAAGDVAASSAAAATGRNPVGVLSASVEAPSAATASTSSLAPIPSSTTISSSSVGSGSCYYYTIVYPDSASCCPGVSMGLSAVASRLRKRDDTSAVQAEVAPIVIVASSSDATATDITSAAPPTASTPAADLTAPTTFGDSAASASATASSSAPAAPSTSAGLTCASTTIVRSCADPSQNSDTIAYLDGYKGLSGSPLTIDCGSVGTFTY